MFDVLVSGGEFALPQLGLITGLVPLPNPSYGHDWQETTDQERQSEWGDQIRRPAMWRCLRCGMWTSKDQPPPWPEGALGYSTNRGIPHTEGR